MTLASGTRARLSYVEEVTRGTTPGSPTMKTLRATTRNVNLVKNMLESAEVRADRQKADVRHGFNRVEGGVGFELSGQSYDDFLAYALGGTWAAAPAVALTPTLAITGASGTITRSGGSFTADGFRPGDVIQLGSFTDPLNNVLVTIITCGTTTCTVKTKSGALLVDAAADADATFVYPGKRLDCSTTLKTITLERAFLDIGKYQVFKGVTVDKMSLNIKPEQMVGGQFDLIGMSALALAGASLGAPSAAPGTSPYSSFDGSLFEGGLLNAVCTGLDLSLNNNRQLAGVVGSKYSPDVFDGTADLTGNVMAFFEDEVMFNKFINETESSIFCRLDDLDGTNFMSIVLPRIKYTGGSIDPPQNGPVPIAMPWRALVSSSVGTSMTIQRSNT